jgi:serine/threonine protein kinase
VGPTFLAESLAQRFVFRERLGAGGMGLIDLVYDRVLEREAVLKRCRPRAPGESPASHALRVQLFRREAAITARLEHPGIVPVHDVGLAAAGEPAYIMKRLSGTTLAARGQLAPEAAVDVLLRIADAIAYAHHQGIVHRDLKPDNIWLGADGAVYVLDWGLAGALGSTLDAAGDLGTPPWRAPEQTAEAPADPRMDVWGLGGLLLVALTGQPPHLPLPSGGGLLAIARTCLDPQPAARYPDGAAVAADLRRFLREGLAAADRPTLATRLIRTSRRHPWLTGATLAMLLGGLQIFAVTTINRRAAERIARDILEHPLADRAGRERQLAQLAELPATSGVALARERLRVAQESELILAAADRFQHSGPWPTEITDLSTVLQLAGIDPLQPTAAARLATHVNRAALLRVLVHLQRALLVGRVESPLIAAIPPLLLAAAPDPAWRSLADLLSRPILGSHDLELCQCDASEAALHQADTADVLLALYAPDERLEQLATRRLAQDPGAFWPRIVAARAALGRNHPALARTHALVALGAEPTSFWPHLILAYVALSAGDDVTLAEETTATLAANPDDLEGKTLRAVVLARSGRLADAQALIDSLHEAPHLQHHLQHRMGHPMERTVDALVGAGIVIPPIAPAAGPLVRPPVSANGG